MVQEETKRIGEVMVKTNLLKNDNTLLRLEEATIRKCTLSDDEAKNRNCTELGKAKGRECEELVLIYRPSGCVREKISLDLNELTTIIATTPKTEN
jgi:hypothetical protein